MTDELTGRRIYIYECPTCDDGRFEVLVRYPERDSQVCERCGSALVRRPSGAVMNTRNSRTFVDGHRREDEYYKLKEAGQLEAESYNLPPEKRTEFNREIRKLKKAKD